MCGIAGYHGLHADHDLLERMNDCQQHRGPDGEGIVTSGPCGLAHRRLSIIDVAHGQQPMDTADGRYSIAYNGEVYNYLDLREELVGLGRTFTHRLRHRGRAPGLRRSGAPTAFDRFNGMFGLAIWDREEQPAHPGARPLRHQAALRRPGRRRRRRGRGAALRQRDQADPGQRPATTKRVNERSVYRYLRFRVHEDGTETFFDGIERLAPGEMLDGRRRAASSGACSPGCKEELLERAHEQRPYDDAAAAEYKRRLVESVRLRLQSEVPVGTVAVRRPRLQRRRGHHQPAAERGRRAVDPGGRHPAEHLLGGLPRLDQRRGALRRRRPRRSARATSTRTRSCRRPTSSRPTWSTSSAPRRSRSSPPARTRSSR